MKYRKIQPPAVPGSITLEQAIAAAKKATPADYHRARLHTPALKELLLDHRQRKNLKKNLCQLKKLRKRLSKDIEKLEGRIERCKKISIIEDGIPITIEGPNGAPTYTQLTIPGGKRKLEASFFQILVGRPYDWELCLVDGRKTKYFAMSSKKKAKEAAIAFLARGELPDA